MTLYFFSAIGLAVSINDVLLLQIEYNDLPLKTKTDVMVIFLKFLETGFLFQYDSNSIKPFRLWQAVCTIDLVSMVVDRLP